MSEANTQRDLVRILDEDGVLIRMLLRRDADRYVAEGRVRYSRTRSSIRFDPNNHAHQAAMESKCEYDRAVNGNRVISRKELKRLPVVGSRQRIDRMLAAIAVR